jgi:hypothetical protein
VKNGRRISGIFLKSPYGSAEALEVFPSMGVDFNQQSYIQNSFSARSVLARVTKRNQNQAAVKNLSFFGVITGRKKDVDRLSPLLKNVSIIVFLPWSRT